MAAPERLHHPLFEGKPVGTPDAGAFWRVIASMASPLFTAPTAFRAIKKDDPEARTPGKYDLSTSAPSSSPASAAIRPRCTGRSSSSGCR
jgi:acyl-coenzyme A synthetase/AMP-(fatty) acid ligase